MSKIKTCTVCGKKYEYCGHCDKDGLENSWKKKYCSKDCEDIFDVISKYAYNHISKEEARQILLEKNVNIKPESGLAKFFKEIMICEEKNVNEDAVENIHEDEVKDVDVYEESPQEISPSIETEFKSKRRRRHVQNINK